ncbi:MAG: T9SS type A sorting domain-containing protein, partial [Chitinophagaceae bacterium]
LVVKHTNAASFPVGNSTYNPVDLSGGPLQDWRVRVEDAITNVTAPFAGNVARAIQRQWHVTPDSANPVPVPGVALTFHYNDLSDKGASFDPNKDVKVWHYLGGAWEPAWAAQTPAGTPGGDRSVTASNITYFSPFAISNIDAPLPVSLMTFTGKRLGTVNELKWVTASESSNRGFSVERSTDGRTFTSVGFVTSRGTGGNSSSVQNYSFIDANASGRKWYYRLKQEDFDGRTKLSTVVVLSADKNGTLTVDGVYPNPAKGALSVRLQGGAVPGTIILQLTDMQGRTVKLKSVSVDAGTSTTATIDLGGLSAGQYHLKAIAPDGTASETITVVKQ